MSDTVVSGGDAPQTPTPAPKPAVDPSLSTVEIFSLIHERESQISQIITAGRLNEVRREAAHIRELLKAAADRVTLPADQKVALDDHVAAADRAALALSEAGDAGDPVQSQAQNVELQKELGVVEKMVVGASP